MCSQLRAGLKSTQTLELRLDYLCNAKERATFFSWLLLKRLDATLIATCRSIHGGGQFRGGHGAQLEVLSLAVAAGC